MLVRFKVKINKRKNVIVLFLFLLFVLTGCSNKQYKGILEGPVISWIKNGNKEKASINYKSQKQKNIKSSYYEYLSNFDKKKIKFIFKIKQDETKDNTIDPVFLVSMIVKNNSNKKIKFDENKFIYFTGDKKIFSKKRGILTVNPGKQKFIDNLFSNVAEQSTLGGGAIVYLNKQNILAYDNFVNFTASSKNLKNKKLKTLFRKFDTTDQSDKYSNANNESSSLNGSTSSSKSSLVAASSSNSENMGSSSSSASSSSNSSDSNDGNVSIKNSSEAISAAKNYYGSDTYNGRNLTWFTMSDANGDLINGQYYWVKASDGTTMSGTTLSFYVYPDGSVVQQ